MMERYVVQASCDCFRVIDRRHNSPVFFPATLEDSTGFRKDAVRYAATLNRLAETRQADRRKSERRQGQRRVLNRSGADRRQAERRFADRRESTAASAE